MDSASNVVATANVSYTACFLDGAGYPVASVAGKTNYPRLVCMCLIYNVIMSVIIGLT